MRLRSRFAPQWVKLRKAATSRTRPLSPDTLRRDIDVRDLQPCAKSSKHSRLGPTQWEPSHAEGPGPLFRAANDCAGRCCARTRAYCGKTRCPSSARVRRAVLTLANSLSRRGAPQVADSVTGDAESLRHLLARHRQRGYAGPQHRRGAASQHWSCSRRGGAACITG